MRARGLLSRDLLSRDWRRAPLIIAGAVGLLLLVGIGVIMQSEAAYRDLQMQENHVQAEMIAASVSAALDFGDDAAAHETLDTIRVNRQVRYAGVYRGDGTRVADYARDPARPAPARLVEPLVAPGRAVANAVPVIGRGGERLGTVLLVSDPEPLSRRVTRYVIISLLILMAMLVVGVLGVAQGVLRRANRQLGERAAALARANAELKVQIDERNKAEDQLRQAQKMQALGQLTGGIAHDFNNLLTVIQGSADMLRRPALAEDKRIRFAEAVVQASGRAAALTGQLLAFARRQPLQPEAMAINDLIRGMADLLDRTLGERIEVVTDLIDRSCTIEADRAQLESAVLNIAVNARDAMPDGGRLTIRTAIIDDGGSDEGSDGGQYRMIGLSVSDSGAGMDPDTLERAFEPFFTTKGTGKGTGLGLSQVYGFASQSGGDVRIESRPGEGTTITILLPCSNRPLGAPAAERGAAASTRTGRILIVEDNEEVGEFAEQLLTELGHRVERAGSGEEGLALALADGFDLVFTDVVMPGMTGLELAARLTAERPDLPVILTTGYSDEIAKSGAGGRPMILKPYRPETLAAAIDLALGTERSD
jgi:signal transduction histidine kinase